MEAATTTEEIAFAKELDCRGDLCPMPVYKASMALKQLTAGQVLRLLTDDPGALADIPALARQTANRLLHTENGGGQQAFYLEKGGR